MKALVIGRFQPVHKGHIKLVKEAEEFGLEKLVIGIGVEGNGRTERNPFQYDEVKQMWLPELEKLETPAEIYRIPDIGDSAGYAAHVEAITGCNEEDTVLVSNNPHTIRCFTDFGKNYRVLQTGRAVWAGDGYICATRIREMLREGGNWQEYVPESATRVVEKVDGAGIMKRVGGQYEKQPV